VSCHDRLGIYGGGGSADSEGAGSYLLGINGDVEGYDDSEGKSGVVCGCPNGVVSEALGEKDDGRWG